MSYYGHPYVMTPHGVFQAAAPQQGQQVQLHQQPQQQQQQAGSAQAQHLALANEERQVQAYLQSVKRRREAAEAAARLEAQERQRAYAEREQALRAAAERHSQLVQAARRERAIRETLERERAREAAFAQAVQQRRAEQIKASVEAERRRQTNAAEAYARAIAEQRQRAESAHSSQSRGAVPHPGAAPSTAPTQKTPQQATGAGQQSGDDDVDLDGLNALLGTLFGFNLATEPTNEPPKPKEKKQKKQDQSKSLPAPDLASGAAPSGQAATTGATPATQQAKQPQQGKQQQVATKKPAVDDDEPLELPDDLKQLLNEFLGVYSAPTDASAKGQAGAPATATSKAPEPQGDGCKELVGGAVEDLNSFLSQYGLEFVPDSDSESETDDESRSQPQSGWASLPSANDKNAQKTQTQTQKQTTPAGQTAPKIVNESGWAALPSANDKNAQANQAAQAPAAAASKPTGAPATPTSAGAPKTESPATSKIVNESGWAALPSANDKNANKQGKKARALPKQAYKEPDEEAPFTSTLGSYQNMPPYLRDILSQVEAAMAEDTDNERDCGCNAETRTPCPHGKDGHPCEAHRRKQRRERAAEKRRLAKERRRERKSKRYGVGIGEEADEEAIPSDVSHGEVKEHANVYADAAAKADDIHEHRSVYDQAAAEGKDIEQHRGAAGGAANKANQQNIAATEAKKEAIPSGEPASAVKEHREVYEQAAEAAEPATKKAAVALDAKEAKKEAIPSDATRGAVQQHEAVYKQAAEEVRDHPIDYKKVIAADEQRAEDLPGSAAAIKEHRSVYDAAAAKGEKVETGQTHLHATAPAFTPSGAAGTPHHGNQPEKVVPKHKRKSKAAKKEENVQPSTPEAHEAIKKLDAIEGKLTKTVSSFKFPRKLSFAPSLADASQPPLLYTRNNTAYHAQAHNLMQLMLEVDGVQSGGDKAVRNRRKQVIKEIESALNTLERQRDTRWRDVRARRERGESDDSDDEWNAGTTTEGTSDMEA